MKKILLLFFILSLAAFTSNIYAEVKFDFGGQLRFRPEMRNNRNFNNDIKDRESFYGQRVRLNLSAAASDNLKGFIVVQDARQWGSVSNVGTSVNENVDHENLDLYQAYVQIDKLLVPHLSLKAGRQTLVYGDQRLLGHLGWKDQARSFDAIKLIWSADAYSSDLFLSKLKEDGGESFDTDQDIFGIYNTLKMIPDHIADFYYFLWADGSNNKRVHTFGTRIKGSISAFDYTAEGVGQTGDWTANVKQGAYAFAVKAGYTLPIAKTRIGVEYDRGSGDDKTDTGKHSDFVFPFHTNHVHYGYMDYFSWGNMSDLSLSVRSSPVKKITLKADYHLFYLVEEKGDWLNVAGTGNTSGMSGKSSYSKSQAGSEIDLTVKFKQSKNLKLTGGYSVFFPGDAVKERKDSDDISTWGYLMMTYTF